MAIKTTASARAGRRIRELRLAKGMSQEEVAAPNYTAAYLSHVEHGKRRPSQEALSHFAERLGLTLDQLVHGRDPNEDLRQEVAAQRATALIHNGRVGEAMTILTGVLKWAGSSDQQRVKELAETGIALGLYRLGRISEAVATYDRVLESLLDRPPERRTSVLVGKARCLFHLNELRESIYLLEAHVTELERAEQPDPGCLVETYAALIPSYFESGMIDRAMQVASKGWKLAPMTTDPEPRACLYVNRAQLLLTQGHPREALASLALAEDLYRHLVWHSEAVKVSLARSFVITEQGRYQEAEALIREALGEAGDAISKTDEIRALARLAFIRRKTGQPEDGLRLARKALKLAGAAFTTSAAEARREAGLCCLELENERAAISHWRRALKDFRSVGDHEEAAKTAKLLGEHLVNAGDLEGAVKVFGEGLSSVADIR